MLRHIRKSAWLIGTIIAVVSLTTAVIMAHEGRPVGDYRLIVGWQEEPAYEGSQNAVSVRVNKIVEGEAMPEAETEEGDHGPPGHHGEESESKDPGSSESKDPPEPKDQGGDEGENHHGNGDGASEDKTGGSDASRSHGSGGHHDTTIEAASLMSVDIETSADSVSGLNVQIITEGFAFAATSVNEAHVDREGHAHIYVNGEKITRVYTPWYYLGDLEPGEHEIRVTLNANSHGEYTYGGSKVEVVKVVTVPEPHGHHHGAERVEAQSEMSVDISLEPDPLGGANLFISSTTGFEFAPENAGDHHVGGQGHGHVYVNGVEIGRIYGEAMQLGNLAEGENRVRVTLNSHEHSVYTWNGETVEATATIDIAEGMGGSGYGDPPTSLHKPQDKPDGDPNAHGMVEKETGRQLVPQGAAKPLASIAEQHEGMAVPVEGLEESLQVEVTHVGTGASRVFDLEAVWGDPGHYVAGLIPTASGVYEFRVFGTVEGMDIDETFASLGGGGGFDDIQSSAELQFPEQLPETREIVGAVQGARDIAQQAQDAALAAQAGETGGGNVLAIVALVIGIVGATLGTGGVFLAVRARQGQ